MKSSISKIFIFFLTLFSPIHILTSTQDKNKTNAEFFFQKPIAMENMVVVSYNNRQDLEAFNYAISANKYTEKAAIGGYLPQLSLSGKALSSYDYEIIPWRNFTVELSQLILSFDGPIDQFKIAQQGTYILKTQKQELKNNIRFRTEQTFLDLKKSLLKTQLIKALEKSSGQTYDLRASQFGVGLISKPDWEKVRSAYTTQQASIENYPNDVLIARTNLERQTNEPIPVDTVSLQVKKVDTIKFKPVNYYLTKALVSRPELKGKDHMIRQAEYSEMYYKKQYLPQVSVFASVSKNKMPCQPNLLTLLDDDIQKHPTIISEWAKAIRSLRWSAGVSVDWSFDGLTNAHTGASYEEKATEFLLQKRDLELQIIENIKEIYLNVKNLLIKLKPTETKYLQTQKELEKQSKAYEVGLIKKADYSQAILDNEQAKYNLTTLKIDIRKGYQQLLFQSGYPEKFE